MQGNWFMEIIDKLISVVSEFGNGYVSIKTVEQSNELIESSGNDAAISFEQEFLSHEMSVQLFSCLFNVYRKGSIQQYEPKRSSQSMVCELQHGVCCAALSVPDDDGFVTKIRFGEMDYVNELVAANSSLKQLSNGSYLLSIETIDGLNEFTYSPSQVAALVNGQSAISEVKKLNA